MTAPASIPLASLIELCRVLRHSLGAGMNLHDVFRRLGTQGPGAVRRVAAQIGAELDRGESLEDALRQQKEAFPPLFLALAGVGEKTGRLPEVLGELEKYYDLQLRLRRDFLARAAWPAFQFLAAILLIAVLLWVTGFVAQTSGTKPLDPLGLGLTGGKGALIFLFLVVSLLATLVGIYWIVSRGFRDPGAADAFLLRVPGLGGCLQAWAVARFSTALRLSQEAGMPIDQGLALALEVTGNGAFVDQTEMVQQTVRTGDELTLALTRAGVFPQEFLDVMVVGVETGRLTQVLDRQAQHYAEEAGRRMAALASAAGYLLWAVVGLFIIVTIFRIYFSYLEILNQF
jgi:type IV pilus assembly protein PilC